MRIVTQTPRRGVPGNMVLGVHDLTRLGQKARPISTVSFFCSVSYTVWLLDLLCFAVDKCNNCLLVLVLRFGRFCCCLWRFRNLSRLWGCWGGVMFVCAAFGMHKKSYTNANCFSLFAHSFFPLASPIAN